MAKLINGKEISAQIRAEIKEKGYTADMLSFSEVVGAVSTGADGKFNSDEYNGVVTYLGSANVVPLSMPLKGNPIIVFIKKVIRKLTRVTIRPIAQHQTEYNAYTARAFSMIGNYIEESSMVSNADLLNRLEVMELKLQTAAKEIDKLNARIAELEKTSE